MAVNETPERDRGLLGLVERLIRRTEAPQPDASADGRDDDSRDPVIPGDVASESLEPQMAIESTRTLNHIELSDVILRALRATDGCPAQGLEVIVYGSKPWNAMLRITPAAGRVPDAAAWRGRVQNMIPLLRQQYDLAEPAVSDLNEPRSSSPI